MEFDPLLLEIVVCPRTHQPLRLPSPVEATRFGRSDILIRADGCAAYPVREGIPSLLLEDLIELPAEQENSPGE